MKFKVNENIKDDKKNISEGQIKRNQSWVSKPKIKAKTEGPRTKLGMVKDNSTLYQISFLTPKLISF